MSQIVVGPLLRFVSGTEATVFVETDGECEVEILGRTEPTFRIEGHHYALVRLEGLEPGSRYEYEVALDGERRWPEPGSELPPSVIRTLGGNGPLRICFGSCRVALPHEPPYTESKDTDEDGFEVDALRMLARRMIEGDAREWPDQLFLLGDQIYVDEAAPETRDRIRQRRGTDTPPGEEVADFEEYTWLYAESWREPVIRWLFSTVSLSMLWDDHDMSDDWNISVAWLGEIRRQSWWHRRAEAGIVSYWIYQHLGNLSPAELDENDVYRQVRGNQRADEPLFEWAREINATGAGTRWSFYRDFGRTRAIFIDSRAGRVLKEDRRAIVDDEEWDWIVRHAHGDFDHLLIATTVPFLLSPAFHHLEAWNEEMCDGALGSVAARAGEKLRCAVDFDHWAAFQESFGKLRDLLAEVAEGKLGSAPGSVVVLSGDVHHAYLCEVGFKADAKRRSPVYQAVCSPYRNPLDQKERRVVRAGFTGTLTAFARLLARLAGAPDPEIRWRLLDGPCFDNQVATLDFEGRSATMRLEKTVPGREDDGALEQSFERRLA
jgi:PhoD-like phosphatase